MKSRARPTKFSKRRPLGLPDRLLRAALPTALLALVLFIFWLLLLGTAGAYVQILGIFAALFWIIPLFYFAIRFTEGTIYEHGFLIARNLFLVIFLVLVTSGGVLSIEASNSSYVLGFVPVLGLIVFASLLDVTKALLETLESRSHG